MVDRIRTEFRRVLTGEGGGKRMSQAELDAYRRQLVMLVVTGATVLVVLILGIGAFYQYVYLPRQAVAQVEGETITKTEYWDFRKYQLLTQINQYQQLAQMMEGQQAQQYEQLAVEANQEFENIENADVDPATVDEMITNRILMNAVDEFGIEITDQEIEDHMVEYFAGRPVGEESAGPAADPTAEAWATATAEAQQEATPESGAENGPDDERSNAEDGDTPAEESGDQESDENEENAGDGEQTSAESESTSTPTPQPTPGEEEIRATAESNQSDHERFLLDRADLSEEQFIDMIIRPNIAREKIRERLAEDVPTRAEQVKAAHILVATEDAANQIYENLTADDAPEFATVAEEESTDSQTAPNGGDLGWFPRDVMVPAFDEVVFDLEVGAVSEPFQTEFGWHVATVQEREEDRPISLSVLQQLRQQAFDDWLQERRESIEIETEGFELPEDPGQAQSQFRPPAGAPQPPQPQMPTQPGGESLPTEGGDEESDESSGEDGSSDDAESDGG